MEINTGRKECGKENWHINKGYRTVPLAALVDRTNPALSTPMVEELRNERDDINGSYTVSHGYRSLMVNRSNTGSQHEFMEWKKLWKMPIPPKVVVVHSVIMIMKPLITYIFCECQCTKPLWGVNGLNGAVNLYQFMNVVVASFTSILQKYNDEGGDDSLIWVIWFSRNEAVWGTTFHRCLPGKAMWMHATCLLWMQAYGQAGGSRTGSNPPVWSPPPAGYLKCNVDAAVFTNGVGVGVVVRNEEGKFVAAHGAKLNCFNDPFMAVKEALKCLKINHFNNVILETDCLNFCSAFNSVALNLSYVGLIVRQCRVLASDIGNFCVRHVNMSTNHLAHVLARAMDSVSGLGSWFSVSPTCISSLIDA
ncbi:PREDICTED: uncharacterized protein LOC109171998 [Ipomoea nil]|uniref:uncharacterized protein LOC109171998 n=1 Tax=Ipomoea nil TaxID=35883 RepID=UPI000901FAD8|nr:PREDICTED: uncharacterized protein LOC109171998 [Ipomoea nil]